MSYFLKKTWVFKTGRVFEGFGRFSDFSVLGFHSFVCIGRGAPRPKTASDVRRYPINLLGGSKAHQP